MLGHHRRRFGEQYAIRINKANLRALTKKRDRLALHDGDTNLVRQQTHDRSVLDPGNLLKLLATFTERHKENIAADIFAKDRQHLSAAYLPQAGGLNVTGARDAKA